MSFFQDSIAQYMLFLQYFIAQNVLFLQDFYRKRKYPFSFKMPGCCDILV